MRCCIGIGSIRVWGISISVNGVRESRHSGCLFSSCSVIASVVASESKGESETDISASTT